jgi:hypothetical protein
VKGGSYKACAFVTGDDALQDELQSIRLATHKAMLIIRDPPGGMSFASYQNIQATVVLEAHKRSHFVGVDAGVSLKVGFAEEGLVCLHIGAAQCIKNVELRLLHSNLELCNKWYVLAVERDSDSFMVSNLNVKYTEVENIIWDSGKLHCNEGNRLQNESRVSKQPTDVFVRLHE